MVGLVDEGILLVDDESKFQEVVCLYGLRAKMAGLVEEETLLVDQSEFQLFDHRNTVLEEGIPQKRYL